MGLFGGRRKWESYSVEEIGAEIVNLVSNKKTKEAKEFFNNFKNDAKRGKIPGITPKEQKEMEKIYKRASEGERGIKAALASIKDLSKASGNNGYRNRPISARVHPSMLKKLQEKGKLGTPGYSTSEALAIKQNNPAMYQEILEREARRQGLI